MILSYSWKTCFYFTVGLACRSETKRGKEPSEGRRVSCACLLAERAIHSDKKSISSRGAGNRHSGVFLEGGVGHTRSSHVNDATTPVRDQLEGGFPPAHAPDVPPAALARPRFLLYASRPLDRIAHLSRPELPLVAQRAATVACFPLRAVAEVSRRARDGVVDEVPDADLHERRAM